MDFIDLTTLPLEGETALETSFTLNGKPMTRRVGVRQHVIDFVREELGLTGSHVGCEHGVCGACAIRVDGTVVRGCLMLAVRLEGKHLETIEHLSRSDALVGELQAAFVARNALQCGFCTPGMIVTAAELIERDPTASRETIRQQLGANYCRCTGYHAIVDAIESVARERTHRV